MNKLEKILQKAAYQYCVLRGLFVYHPPNGEERPKIQNKNGSWYCPSGKDLKEMGTIPGVCDLLFFSSPHLFTEDGRYKYKGTAIEFKVGKNRPTPDQIEFMEKLTATGWLIYVIYDSIDVFIEIIDDLYPSITPFIVDK